MRHLVFFQVISENIVSKNISLGIEIYEVFYETNSVLDLPVRKQNIKQCYWSRSSAFRLKQVLSVKTQKSLVI